MAKVLCSFSGIEFKCEHLPIVLTGRETAHPVFFLPTKKLLGVYSKYLEGTLSPSEEYLLFLAYLNGSELVEFRVPAKYTENTQALIAKNFDKLVQVITNIQTIHNPKFSLAKIAITPATSTLDNVHHWIENWESSYNQFLKGQDDRKLIDNLQVLEAKLQRLTNAQTATMQGKYNTTLAEWAAKAFKFPEFLIDDNGRLITLANYWKLIIKCCQNQDKIFQFPREDIEELRNHIIEYIDCVPKWGIDLLGIVEDGIELHKNFLGLGDIDLARSSTTYTMLTEIDTVQTANLQAIIQSAPKQEPIESEYPTRFSYLKAKMNWNLARNLEGSK